MCFIGVTAEVGAAEVGASFVTTVVIPGDVSTTLVLDLVVNVPEVEKVEEVVVVVAVVVVDAVVVDAVVADAAVAAVVAVVVVATASSVTEDEMDELAGVVSELFTDDVSTKELETELETEGFDTEVSETEELETEVSETKELETELETEELGTEELETKVLETEELRADVSVESAIEEPDDSAVEEGDVSFDSITAGEDASVGTSVSSEDAEVGGEEVETTIEAFVDVPFESLTLAAEGRST